MHSTARVRCAFRGTNVVVNDVTGALKARPRSLKYQEDINPISTHIGL